MKVQKNFFSLLLATAIIEYCHCFSEFADASLIISDDESITTTEDWKPYKNNKEFKLIRTFLSHEEAEDFCTKQALDSDIIPTLASIKSMEELNFLNNYIYNEQAVEQNVWIGATKVDRTLNFQWTDGSPVDFNNWGSEFPSNQLQSDCVEMQSIYSKMNNGEWGNVRCSGGKWFICQKIKPMNLPELNEAVLKLQEQLSNLKSELEENSVPEGFMYIQLPNQAGPQQLWKSVEWQDVSGDYAGQFFRVEGGKSKKFGQVQAESYKTVTNVQYVQNTTLAAGAAILTPGEWSNYVYSGVNSGGGSYEKMRFYTSNEEIRPLNNAIRVWKRVGKAYICEY